MAPRKAPSAPSTPKVVRRVVKTVTTEEFFDDECGGESKRTVTTEVVEETLDGGGPLLPKVSKTIQKKSKSAGAAAKRKKTASMTGKGSERTGSTRANKTAASSTAASSTAASRPAASRPAASTTSLIRALANMAAKRKTAAKRTAASKTAASKTAASKTAASKTAASKTTASKTAAGAAKSKAKGTTVKMDVNTNGVATSAPAKRGARKSTTPTSAAKRTRTEAAATKTTATKTEKVTAAAPRTSISTSAGTRGTKKKTPSKAKSETKPVTPNSRIKTKPETKAATSKPATSQGRAGAKPISMKATSKLQPASTAARNTTKKGKTEAPTSSTPVKTVKKQAVISKSEGKLRVQTPIRKTSKRKGAKPSKQVKGEVHDVMDARLLNEAYLAGKQAAQEEMNTLALKHYGVPPQEMVSSLHGTRENLPSAVGGSDVAGITGANLRSGSHAARATQVTSFPTVTPTRRARRVKQTARRSSGVQQVPNVSDNHTGHFVPPYMPTSTAVEHVPDDAREAVPARQTRRFKQTARKSAGLPIDGFDAASSASTHAARQGSANTGIQGVSTMNYSAGDWFTAAPSASTLAARQVNANTDVQRVSKLNSCGGGGFVWTLVHELGFFPDGFHSSMEPTKRELGEFWTRDEAVRVGKDSVGNEDYPWEELVQGGDLEIVSDSDTKWEALWSPPDSQYSRVTAMRVCLARGRWLVEVEFGYPPSRFHSYVEPEKKTVGTFATREAAVREARTAMGSRWGIEWEELCEMGELEVVRDGAEKYEARWVAGDSEYAHVLARRLGAVTTGL